MRMPVACWFLGRRLQEGLGGYENMVHLACFDYHDVYIGMGQALEWFHLHSFTLFALTLAFRRSQIRQFVVGVLIAC